MSAKLTIRTDANEIPADVGMLIDDVRKKLGGIQNSKLRFAMEKLSSTTEIAEAVGILQGIQRDLGLISQRLEDCASILSQYHEILNSNNDSPSLLVDSPEGS